jgi:hypothetical protein
MMSSSLEVLAMQHALELEVLTALVHAGAYHSLNMLCWMLYFKERTINLSNNRANKHALLL